MPTWRAIFAGFLIASAALAAPSADIPSLVKSLGDPDPVSRETATQALRKQGAAARAELLAATKSDDLEIAARASMLLRELPWYLPDDPPGIRNLLEVYGKGDENARVEAVRRIHALWSVQAHAVLCRLLREEPSDSVRWAIEAMLRTMRGERFRAKTRELDLAGADDNAPLIAAVGWSWHGRDAKKSTELLRRAAEIQLGRPTEDYQEVASIVAALTDEAILARRYDDAADLLRRASFAGDASARLLAWNRTLIFSRNFPGDGLISGDELNLLALHAEHGPLKGIVDDVRKTGTSALSDPRLLYCASRWLERMRLTILARAIEVAAFELGPDSAEYRITIGQFLLVHGWDRAAQRELIGAIDSPAVAQNKPYLDRFARAMLAKAAADENDFVGAANQLRQLTPQNPTNTDESRRIAGELNWRLYQAARAANDDAAARQALDKLASLMPTSGEIAMDAVPALKKLGRADDAQRLFAAAYNAQRSASISNNGEIEDPEYMNNLAWLCARSGERLDEALKLSTQAITIEPDNPAYLDTAAEANFRLGKRDEAVRLESKALDFRPDDKFMRGQLDRFKKADEH